MIKPTLLQKIGSKFIPVKIWKGSSRNNPVLELFLYKGEWQLGTDDALYSTGTRYRPLVVGFRRVKSLLGSVHRVLVLGAGLGSAGAILAKMGFRPHFTLVDIDEAIIDWAMHLMDAPIQLHTKFVVQDAETFVSGSKEQYELLVIDIFNSLQVPEFVSTIPFLENCRGLLTSNGCLIANYVIPSSAEWTQFQQNFTSVFPITEIITLGVNRVLIAKV